ncbi:MAG: hypothetical protein MUF49_01515 [Oculatellaceae cyanobacterium Prado106]|jgi:hypothetical protein|nr:hypothetical protein [Oculatellaceae cyanobacterium Prado106]
MALTHDRKYRPVNQKTIVTLLISGAIAAGSSFAWIGAQRYQASRIQQARVLLSEACTTSLSTPNQVGTTTQQLNQAVQQLQSVPRFPGLGYETAQTELQNSAQCILRVQSTNQFEQARTLAQPAATTDLNAVLPAQEWQARQDGLNQAIALLNSIPANSPVYPQAQEQLGQYQAIATQIAERLQAETAAISTYQQANGIIEQVNTTLQTSIDDPAALAEASTSLGSAIQLLESIPAGTTAFAQSQQSLPAYRQQQIEVERIWVAQTLNPIVDQFTNFAESVNPNTGFSAYTNQVNQLRDSLTSQTQNFPTLANNPVTQALDRALSRYDDAAEVWRYCNEGNCFNSIQAGFILSSPTLTWVPSTLEVRGQPLAIAYPTNTSLSLLRRQRLVQLDVVLEEIWTRAELEIQQSVQASSS